MNDALSPAGSVADNPFLAGLDLPAGLMAGHDAYGPILQPSADYSAVQPWPAGQPMPAGQHPGDAASAVRVSLLPEFGLLNAEGTEAITFLNGQTTNDVVHLAADGVQLDGYCTPKGRLIASFITWRHEQGLYLALARDLAAPVAKRLAMFVMRAKLKVLDQSAAWLALGLQGPGVSQAIARLGLATPAAWRQTRADGLMALGLPDPTEPANGLRVMLWIAPGQLQPTLARLQGSLAGPQHWRLADIEAGLPRIVKASSELFVPQMVNFDLIAAVNFKKGCYPGQEVVARSQYLGKLKRRMFKGSTTVAAQPGADIHLAGGGEAVGQVVMAAPAAGSDGRWMVLAELTGAAAQTGSLLVGDAALRLEPLPYDVPIV